MSDTYTAIGRIREELRRQILLLVPDPDDAYLDDYNLQGANHRSLIEEHPDHNDLGYSSCAAYLRECAEEFHTKRKHRPPFAWAGGHRPAGVAS